MTQRLIFTSASSLAAYIAAPAPVTTVINPAKDALAPNITPITAALVPTVAVPAQTVMTTSPVIATATAYPRLLHTLFYK